MEEEAPKKSFLDAVLNGKRTHEMSRRDINQLCSYSYIENPLEALKTIHFRGIKKSPYSLVKKMLWSLGVDRRKIKFLTFISMDTLEVDLFESYVDELTSILENAHKKENYKNFIVKRITGYKEIEQTNQEKDEENIFQKGMAYKIEKIKNMLPTTPHLRRMHNYVALQIKNNSIEINMKPLVPYTETMSTYIDKKFAKKIKMDCDSDNSTEIEDSSEIKGSNHMDNLNEVCSIEKKNESIEGSTEITNEYVSDTTSEVGMDIDINAKGYVDNQNE